MVATYFPHHQVLQHPLQKKKNQILNQTHNSKSQIIPKNHYIPIKNSTKINTGFLSQLKNNDATMSVS
jgi:hypothetical protein